MADSVQYFDEFWDDSSAQKVSDNIHLHREAWWRCELYTDLDGTPSTPTSPPIPTISNSACEYDASRVATSAPKIRLARSSIWRNVKAFSTRAKAKLHSQLARSSGRPFKVDHLTELVMISGAVVLPTPTSKSAQPRNQDPSPATLERRECRLPVVRPRL